MPKINPTGIEREKYKEYLETTKNVPGLKQRSLMEWTAYYRDVQTRLRKKRDAESLAKV